MFHVFTILILRFALPTRVTYQHAPPPRAAAENGGEAFARDVQCTVVVYLLVRVACSTESLIVT